MRNEQIRNRGVLFGVVLSLVMLTVPLALAAPSMYIDPQTKNLNCGESSAMEVRITTEASTAVAQAHIHFDPACVNITDVDYTGAAWQPLSSPGWSHQGDYVITATANFYPVVDAGDHLFATITVECVCGDGSCTSDIWLDNLAPVYPTVNGTFTCGAGAQPQCLGTCCNDSACTNQFAENVPCKECIEAGRYWHPNMDTACFDDMPPSDLCLDWCPECCDGVNNDDTDTNTDYPDDTECTCGLDPSEAAPLDPIPELSTFLLTSLGILSLVLLTRKRD